MQGGHEAPPLQVIVTSPKSVGVPLVGTHAISNFTQNRQWLMLARSSPIWIYSSEHNEDYQIERDSDGNNWDEETINSCNRSLDRDDPDTLCNRGL